MNRPSALSASHRRDFGRLLREARETKGLDRQELADRAYGLLPGDAEPIPADWIRRLEVGPPRPLSDVVRLDVLLRVLGLTWPVVLHALGARASMEPPTDEGAPE